MNPFTQNSKPVRDNFLNWKQMYPKPYNKSKASPYTKLRIILAGGAEFDSVWFLHQFARHCADNDLRREIALIRNQEQQQQKRIGALKPMNENFLETTISYEQLAIELTAILAERETEPENIKALNMALLEDFDHLFRFANLLKMDFGIDAETILGKFTEVMPGRPTINEHRHPYDNVKYSMCGKTANPFSKLAANIITAAEQQTMNFYMNMAANYHNDIGRKLFAEIAMVEESHVTQYECLADPTCGWLEMWLFHEYTECYLYWSCVQDEPDAEIKKIWQEHFLMEVAHLKHVAALLEKYEKKRVRDIIPAPEFPAPLLFGQTRDYLRKIIEEQVWLTSAREGYVDARKVGPKSDFHFYNNTVNISPENVASHLVITQSIRALGGTDHRFQTKPHPIPELDDRKKDNVIVGRG
jgi:rubrerythrin